MKLKKGGKDVLDDILGGKISKDAHSHGLSLNKLSCELNITNTIELTQLKGMWNTPIFALDAIYLGMKG